jgi:hypothetical protein
MIHTRGCGPTKMLCRISKLGSAVRLTLASIFAFPRFASAFSGPWDSAHVPPTISNPEIAAGPDPQDPSILMVAIAYNVGCPNGNPIPFTVTFSDPAGSIVDQATNPCNSTWSPGSNDNADFRTSPSVAIVDNSNPTAPTSGPFDLFFNMSWYPSTPFVYTVSNASGVLAQARWKGTTGGTPPTTIDEWNHPDDFINICSNGNYPIYSMNGEDLYCVVGGSDAATWVKDDWRPPPPPYLTATKANRLLSSVLISRFGNRLRQFSTGCDLRKSHSQFACFPFFSLGGYAYFGTATRNPLSRPWWRILAIQPSAEKSVMELPQTPQEQGAPLRVEAILERRRQESAVSSTRQARPRWRAHDP